MVQSVKLRTLLCVCVYAYICVCVCVHMRERYCGEDRKLLSGTHMFHGILLMIPGQFGSGFSTRTKDKIMPGSPTVVGLIGPLQWSWGLQSGTGLCYAQGTM